MAKKTIFNEEDQPVEIETVFCDYCDKEFRPIESTATEQQIFCSQVCEIYNKIESTDEVEKNLDLKHGKWFIQNIKRSVSTDSQEEVKRG